MKGTAMFAEMCILSINIRLLMHLQLHYAEMFYS